MRGERARRLGLGAEIVFARRRELGTGGGWSDGTVGIQSGLSLGPVGVASVGDNGVGGSGCSRTSSNKNLLW